MEHTYINKQDTCSQKRYIPPCNHKKKVEKQEERDTYNLGFVRWLPFLLANNLFKFALVPRVNGILLSRISIQVNLGHLSLNAEVMGELTLLSLLTETIAEKLAHHTLRISTRGNDSS